jgi:hypothetical protein
MKSYSEHLNRASRQFFVAMVLAVAVSIGIYLHQYNVASAVAYFIGFSVTNIVIWHGVATAHLLGESQAVSRRMKWEASMLNAMQLAAVADTYHVHDPNIVSAYHAAVQTRHDEGVKLGYLDLGQL